MAIAETIPPSIENRGAATREQAMGVQGEMGGDHGRSLGMSHTPMIARPWSPWSGVGGPTESGLSRKIMATNSLTNPCELSETAKDASQEVGDDAGTARRGLNPANGPRPACLRTARLPTAGTPHLALYKDAPLKRTVQRFGRVAAIPVLAGLHHQYVRI